MPCILNIETATEVCSVAISHDGKIIFAKEETKGPSHAVLLGVFVEEAMQYLRSQNITLDAVAVSCGPGSYTGLRIGVSEAKGLCYGLGIPLIAINTLTIMASGLLATQAIDTNTLLCPMIDARRMEVYDTVFDGRMEEVRPVTADIIDENSFSNLLVDNKMIFFGNGAGKCKEVLHHHNAIFVEGIYPQATNMFTLAEEAYQGKAFADVAYFEPFYLKEFVATVPKNKVLPGNK
ncbi:tRNA (adenosine(37)-N6)-threonylcarbamoyltransferase complex dimerization subunit type 1 TsaB [Dysgonomonas sp. 511]|uniref:tRNA (adenosine(37)-N6)-threonylcarbamoyltransferase complex dimerization subunit type 1 TsaB n=1 Tax=Dysgonomonas sp. 511 TaxID=2302930 RepID=UPI0013D1C39B|nr:tRNA (adenosine(37)-N6)-threonylcarbamoyltransferase complex dimerization subunit type 1 TsaB [Dysgonomonas sp. 511]NDV79824.1 tRNA (adenosine(37)-N6)-threonylcarbamoyltransferase complex dimerization subunit type 1 TsaB [Dysgonomonas sp. 511]